MALKDLNYDLEIERIIEEIRKTKPKRVLLQLPDGFKQYSKDIVDTIENNMKNHPEIYIWVNSNFGSCDIPNSLKELNIDLLVHFGHEKWQ